MWQKIAPEGRSALSEISVINKIPLAAKLRQCPNRMPMTILALGDHHSACKTQVTKLDCLCTMTLHCGYESKFETVFFTGKS